MLFQESFETDGSGTRYVVIGEGDDGALDVFGRRQVGSAGTKAEGGTLDGEWMWKAERIQGAPGPRGSQFPEHDLLDSQGRLIFSNIDISGMGNLRLKIAAATGNGRLEPNDDLYVRVRFDGGDWIEIGGFKSSTSNSRPIYYRGLRDTLTIAGNPNMLFRFFSDWDWPLYGSGTTLDMQITIASNARDDEHYIDNIRILGDPTVSFFSPTVENSFVVEPVSGGVANPVTIVLAEPAPAGGVEFSISGNWESMTSVSLPASPVRIEQGETMVVVPMEVVQDGRFTGTKTIELVIEAPGYNPEMVRFQVENTTPRPDRLVIMEAMNVVPGTHPSHLFGDANNDGRYHNTGDQFIEIVNFEDYPIDLSGWRIGDDLSDRHLIPDGTVLFPNQALVVFGGGEPRGVFGGAIVQVASAGGNGLGYNITSRGEFTYITAPFGEIVDLVELPMVRADILAVTNNLPEGHAGRGVSASVHRLSKERGDIGFVMSVPNIHSMIAGAGERLFSPGTWIDGTPYFDPENEIQLSIDNPVIREDAGPNAATGTLVLSSPAPEGGLEITLETNGVVVRDDGSFIPNEIDLDSLTVVVPAGATTADFRIGAHNDGVLDGDQVVLIYARAGPYVLPGFAEMLVEDVEVNDLNVVINEVLLDVEGTASDPNLDGRLEDLLGDQFVEIVNASGRPVNVSGWSVTWESGDTFALVQHVHTFLPGSVLPDQSAAVVFGRISAEAAQDPIFGGALVQGAREPDGNIKADGLNLPLTTSFFMKLRNEHGFVVDEVRIEFSLARQDMSLTRSPDVTGEMDLHLDAHLSSGAFDFLIFSPGLRLDGTPFPGSGTILIYSVFERIAFAHSSGWFIDPIFGPLGSGLQMPFDMPWVYAAGHQDFWYVLSSRDGFWLYSVSRQGWYFTSYDLYPLVWSGSERLWLEF